MAMRPVIYLELSNPEIFIAEIKKRRIREVRVNDWRHLESFILTLKSRFTAFDQESLMILRMEITYYYGLFEPKSEECRQRIRAARDEIVGPIIERIGKVASVRPGEFHLGSLKW